MSYLLAVLIALCLRCGYAPQANERQATPDETAVIGCFASKEWVISALSKIGLHRDEVVTVRFGRGAILGLAGDRSDMQVLFVGSPETQAFMGFAYRGRDGVITVSPDGYYLERKNNVWFASEGNGGIATYTAIGRDAKSLDEVPTTKIRLTKETGQNC